MQAYGLTAMPIGMIRGRKSNRVEEIEVQEDLASTRAQRQTLQSKVRSATSERRWFLPLALTLSSPPLAGCTVPASGSTSAAARSTARTSGRWTSWSARSACSRAGPP